MNLRQRCQKVFKAGYQFGQTSFRSLALKTNLSKSSVHRLYRRIVSRNQHPESELWETEAGQKWLRLLVLATIFVFALQGGIGCERLSQFFRLLRLQRHIGVSPTAIRSLRAQMESAIIDYQQQQHEPIGNISSQVEVCAAADETFFDQVILVMLDLPSGYIFVEEITSQHPVTVSLSLSARESWWNWAIWMVSKFQRSSSAVEGRNGYLSQVHHNRRGLSTKRLQVSTVIHNFFLKRSDGTTAAQRLFGREFPDLFEYLVEHIGELPQPRKSRKSSNPEILTSPAVPL